MTIKWLFGPKSHLLGPVGLLSESLWARPPKKEWTSFRQPNRALKSTGDVSDPFSSFLYNVSWSGLNQQFTYGVIREGVIAEKLPQIFAQIPQTFCRISAPFPDAIKRIFANFPQNFRKKPFANDPISELLIKQGVNKHKVTIFAWRLTVPCRRDATHRHSLIGSPFHAFFPKKAWVSQKKCSFSAFCPFLRFFWPKKGSVPLF